MKIALASDHGGFKLKELIKTYLEDDGLTYEDMGSYDLESVDYPDFTLKVAEAVARGEYEKGIVVCSTGLGVSMVCNKVPGIRAALCGDCFSARYSREHNDANILAIGERVTGPGLALSIVEIFLYSRFQGGRHQRRVDKITAIEKKYTGGLNN
ncbi:ribose 5-phosphate isomerase B [Candidatus Contubernalis alkaliaceticus]|uniref:ribose 5-phosphate isomerase B n=1 Tax=Candidatus Contubernalis alkaliaceticus TaxID=338645 RepID=UPI001F4BEFF6|nr:ribose 5-phosphate isomerase B [Candidatus Contubernalis alkalaceticus]UNC93671.1 ribose 5-phosphate isomerase B [Candidatus Contubernalis alkalaceticus]